MKTVAFWTWLSVSRLKVPKPRPWYELEARLTKILWDMEFKSSNAHSMILVLPLWFALYLDTLLWFSTNPLHGFITCQCGWWWETDFHIPQGPCGKDYVGSFSIYKSSVYIQEKRLSYLVCTHKHHWKFNFSFYLDWLQKQATFFF